MCRHLKDFWARGFSQSRIVDAEQNENIYLVLGLVCISCHMLLLLLLVMVTMMVMIKIVIPVNIYKAYVLCWA